ncbi:cation:proton antiporter regulatory subunit [Cohnella thailandensis]|jgi:Putative regulatory, ligand-binding protein related to C-terminal domains of K+ channels|uniref:Cation:proton antiporter regulatory subunit n=1 Tax=Cohnella thailandensis TaxID=557557 RepID=A0A841T132_9BACL|nr:cation:proton antiporter regulatory subunit [Cohnella thailandensis]MBB6637884.1 cation:proton antiporter regulatory subunit [Cohnella thailandensis]MBP1977408.1 TrkA domain protein [Cohnella thailandensis]
MEIRESELPSIGRKFQMTNEQGEKIVIVVHDDGRREIYHFDHSSPDESISMVTLTDEEARQIAFIVGGLLYKPKMLENIDMALGDLVIEWYKLEAGSKCAGHTIGELDIRRKSGATVIAVVGKGNAKQINPGPDYVLGEDSTIVVMGERKQIIEFKQIIRNGCD